MLTLRDAYHGMHFGAMTATGLAQAHQLVPPAPGYVQVMAPHPYRGPLGPDAAPYLDELSRTLHTNTSGAVAGLLAEPIQGYGGIVEMPEGWLRGAAEQVRAAGGVLIVDEVQSGMARTGSHFWCFEAHDVMPDIVVTSKGIGNGFPHRRRDRPTRGRRAHGRADVLQHLRREPDLLRRGSRRPARHRGRGPAAQRASRSAARIREGLERLQSVTRASATCAAAGCCSASTWCATARRASQTPRAPNARKSPSSPAASSSGSAVATTTC